MIEQLKKAAARLRDVHVYHRLVYGGLALTYGAGSFGADKELVGLLVAGLYLLLTARG